MRTFGKVVLAVFCTMFVLALMANEMDGDVLLVPKAATPPTIDAAIDGAWNNVCWTFQRSYGNSGTPPTDATDLTGAFRVMWDDNNLYFLAYTIDDVLYDNHANVWENDGWEIYFDADNSKMTSYDGVDDQQMRYEHRDVAGADADAGSWVTKDNLVFVNEDVYNGYVLELQIPLAELKLPAEAGHEFGFETQQNDNDGANREHISKWWLLEGDRSWLDPSLFGTARLTDYGVSELLPVHKAPSAPVIDGDLDPVWETGSTLIPQNSYTNSGTGPDSFEDLQGSFRLMWDENNLYGFFITRDDVLYDNHANVWENDGWEVYFDADNSKLTSYDGVDDQQMRFEHRDMAGTDADAGSWVDKSKLVFVNKDHDDGMGYNLELAIPWTEIKLTPEIGAEFGFETQQNDNDGANREHISKWWLKEGDRSWLDPSLFGTAVLKDYKTAVKEKGVVARQFGLAQNYPNPFNPTTTIPYTLARTEKVRLAVYDLMGKEVAVLVDGIQSAGSHEAQFTATNLTSGIYFYKLETSDQVLVKKMTLVK